MQSLRSRPMRLPRDSRGFEKSRVRSCSHLQQTDHALHRHVVVPFCCELCLL